MWESICEWIKFWLDCLRDGFEVGDCLFGISELILVILVGWLTYKKRHDLSHYWEDKSVKWVWIILGVAFAVSTVFVAPFLKYSDVESARKKSQAALDDKSPKLVGFNPIQPVIVSNRFYVEVEVPFSNEKRKVVMSDSFGSDLHLPPNLSGVTFKDALTALLKTAPPRSKKKP